MPRLSAAQVVRVTHLPESAFAAANVAQQWHLVYEPEKLPGGHDPDPVLREVEIEIIRQKLDELYDCVQRLIERARAGGRREKLDLEAVIASLGRDALPQNGLAGLIVPGLHPQLKILDPAIAELPWESFHNLHLRRYVTHLATGGVPTELPIGQQFLMIADPQGDLTSEQNDPQGICRDHLETVYRCLSKCGYIPRVIDAANATVTNVLEALGDENVQGLYYFGHGAVESGRHGALLLAKGEPLLADRIFEVQPRLRFAFLNACHAAIAGREWGLRKPLRSIARAFAQGSDGKVVIAPIWRILNTQAAQAAVLFFQRAARDWPLARALRSVRRASYREYLRGSPELSWAAYRYFGALDRRLPRAPVQPTGRPASATHSPSLCRLFLGDGKFNADVFSVPIGDVLREATVRCQRQCRSQVTLWDLVAGLISHGELTRFLLRGYKIEVADFQERLDQLVEQDSAGSNPAGAPAEEAGWVVSGEKDFCPDVAAHLKAADNAAQVRGPAVLISELDILEQVFSHPAWNGSPQLQLPPAADLLRTLRDSAWRSSGLDDNGCLVLDGLDASARAIVDRAQEFSQWRGEFPIPSRLVLAAFLFDEYGIAAERCQQIGIHPELVCAMLVVLTSGKECEPFRLGYHAAERAVLPMLARARQLAAGEPIDEATLLVAFCQVAPGDFKEFLAALPPPYGINLDQLGKVAPPPLQLPWSAEAQLMLRTAAAFARAQGSPDLRSPHLAAALIGDASGVWGQMLRGQGLAPELMKLAILAMVPPQPLGPQWNRQLSPAVAGALQRAQSAARGAGAGEATLADIMLAFTADGGGSVGQVLRMFDAPTAAAKEDVMRRFDNSDRLNIPLESFEDPARSLLSAAATWALLQGSPAVRSPHLFAALIGQPTKELAAELKQLPVPAAFVQAVVLEMVPPQSPSSAKQLTLSQSVAQVLSHAAELSRQRCSVSIAVSDLSTAYFSASNGAMNQELAKLGIEFRILLSPEDSSSTSPDGLPPWQWN